jgi:hypothetical protein
MVNSHRSDQRGDGIGASLDEEYHTSFRLMRNCLTERLPERSKLSFHAVGVALLASEIVCW